MGTSARHLLRPSAAVLLAASCAGCCLFVPAPEAAELLDVGYRTPEQTFRTFQTAWRAEEPDLERRCFSQRFLEEHQVSRLGWRVFREQLQRDEPFLRLGISDAEIDGPVEVRGDRARLVARSHGLAFELELLREGYATVWQGEDVVADAAIPWDADHRGVQETGDGTRWLWVRARVGEGVEPEDVSEVRAGREWKIDAFRELD